MLFKGFKKSPILILEFGLVLLSDFHTFHKIIHAKGERNKINQISITTRRILFLSRYELHYQRILFRSEGLIISKSHSQIYVRFTEWLLFSLLCLVPRDWCCQILTLKDWHKKNQLRFFFHLLKSHKYNQHKFILIK